MAQHEKGRVNEETFDDFLAGQGKEIIATQLAAAMMERGLSKHSGQNEQ